MGKSTISTGSCSIAILITRGYISFRGNREKDESKFPQPPKNLRKGMPPNGWDVASGSSKPWFPMVPISVPSPRQHIPGIWLATALCNGCLGGWNRRVTMDLAVAVRALINRGTSFTTPQGTQGTVVPSGKHTKNIKKLWKITIFNGKIHYKWWFSIAMLNYQRVSPKNVGISKPAPCAKQRYSFWTWVKKKVWSRLSFRRLRLQPFWQQTSASEGSIEEKLSWLMATDMNVSRHCRLWL